VRNLRPTWRSQSGTLILIALSALITLVGVADPGNWGGIVTVIGLLGLAILTVLLLYRHYAHRYYIEEGRIEHQVGIIGRHIRSVRLADLRNVNLRQGIIERMLGIGTLEFSSAGGSGIEVTWSGVRNPTDLKRHIEELRGT
jgi:uncharacterized membrane protein YdbT with pleckstrin-like domain